MERKVSSGSRGKPHSTERRKMSVLRYGLESIPDVRPESKNEFNFREHQVDRNVNCKTRCISLQHRKHSAQAISQCMAGRRCSVPVKPFCDPTQNTLQRVRSFRTTSKGLVNKGDCFRKKSCSVRDGMIQERTVDAYREENGVCEKETTNLSYTDESTNRMHQVEVCGHQSVGKTSLIDQMLTSDYLACTDEDCDDSKPEKTVSVNLNGDAVELSFKEKEWNALDDIKLTSNAYIVVFSVSDKESFVNAMGTVAVIRSQSSFSLPIIIVANKVDMVRSRKVSKLEACHFAEKFDCKYIETSVLLHYHVDELLVGIVKQIISYEHVTAKLKQGEKGDCRTAVSSAKKNKLVSTFKKLFRKNDKNLCEKLL